MPTREELFDNLANDRDVRLSALTLKSMLPFSEVGRDRDGRYIKYEDADTTLWLTFIEGFMLVDVDHKGEQVCNKYPK